MDQIDYTNVSYSDGVVNGPGEYFSAVRRATSVLVEIMGEWFPAGKIEWDVLDTGRIGVLYSVTVEMSEWGLGGFIRFTPFELTDKHNSRILLHRLWGDILREYNHRLIKELAAPGR